jgi:hypothetical protein
MMSYVIEQSLLVVQTTGSKNCEGASFYTTAAAICMLLGCVLLQVTTYHHDLVALKNIHDATGHCQSGALQVRWPQRINPMLEELGSG